MCLCWQKKKEKKKKKVKEVFSNLNKKMAIERLLMFVVLTEVLP